MLTLALSVQTEAID